MRKSRDTGKCPDSIPGKGESSRKMREALKSKSTPNSRSSHCPIPSGEAAKGKDGAREEENSLEQVRDALERDEERCQGWDSASHIPPRVKFSSRVHGKSDWKLLKISPGLQIIQRGGKKPGKVPMEQEGGTRDATSFPRLRHVRAKMHPEQALVNALPAASTANPISMQEEAWFPSRNDAAHEEGEEKRQWGGRTILGHFQTPGLKSISLRIPIGGSVTRGRLRLAALPEPGSVLPNGFPGFIPAQLGFSTDRLGISWFLWAPATPVEQRQPRRRARLPTARLGITPEVSPAFS